MDIFRWIKGPYPNQGEYGKLVKKLKRIEKKYERLNAKAKVKQKRLLKSYLATRRKIDLIVENSKFMGGK